MQSLRTGIGLVGALIPVAYCGGLVWYFADMGGWNDPIMSQQLQPTIVGLAIVGLLFAIGLGFKISRAVRPPKPPGEGGGQPDSQTSLRGDDAGTDPDADAMIARYLSQRAAPGLSPNAPSAAPGAARQSFGRRAR